MKKFLAILTAGLLYASNANIEISETTLGIKGDINIISCNIYARGYYLYNKNKDDFKFIGIKGEGNLINSNVNMKLSVITDFFLMNNYNTIALGIGTFNYLPIYPIGFPLFVKTEFEYAPKILNFDGNDSALRMDIKVGAQFIECASVSIGWRNIKLGKKTYDSSLYGSVSYNF